MQYPAASPNLSTFRCLTKPPEFAGYLLTNSGRPLQSSRDFEENLITGLLSVISTQTPYVACCPVTFFAGLVIRRRENSRLTTIGSHRYPTIMLNSSPALSADELRERLGPFCEKHHIRRLEGLWVNNRWRLLRGTLERTRVGFISALLYFRPGVA
jgi:hypothetical protein